MNLEAVVDEMMDDGVTRLIVVGRTQMTQKAVKIRLLIVVVEQIDHVWWLSYEGFQEGFPAKIPKKISKADVHSYSPSEQQFCNRKTGFQRMLHLWKFIFFCMRRVAFVCFFYVENSLKYTLERSGINFGHVLRVNMDICCATKYFLW